MLALVIAFGARAYAGVEDDLRDGDKYFEEQDWKRASAAYDRAIAKAPSQVSAEAYGKRAAIFIITKDMKGGLDFLGKAKQRWPNAPELLEQEALILWESDHRDEAIKIAEKVIKAKPNAFTNQKLIGEYYAARDPVKTATAFEAYLANRPPELESGDVAPPAMPRIRLGFAYIANARAVLADGDEPHARTLYQKAVDQFELVEKKFGKRANAQVNADNGLCAAYTGLDKWDEALTTCERIVKDAKRVDASGSVWFNLGTAYLARRQTNKARSAAAEYIRLRNGEPRGYILTGDSYFEERDWTKALDQYLRAEKLLKGQSRDAIGLSIKLGKTYRRLPAPSSGPNPNLQLAIDKLATAFNANPNSVDIAIELGDAYVDAKQDAKATVLTDRVLAGAEQAKLGSDSRIAILAISGRSLFNQKKLKEARTRFEAAQQLRANDVTIQRALVETINEQAFEAMKDPKAAQALLEQALPLDPNSPTTLTNLAVLAIERGECDAAQKQLVKLGGVHGADPVATSRLLARTYLCQAKPDPKKAAETFAAAEKEAKKANAQLALAEIYVEWAPLVWDSDLVDAIDKLELAAQIGASDPEVAPAAKRNLALALYRRGWKLMREGKAAEAASDFERTTRDASLLKGTEPLAFEFSYAIALLDSGRAAEAAKLFKQLAGKGNQGAYLKGPYAKVGSQFFAAYASYRTGSGPIRQQACTDLGKLEGELGARVKELVASCWELVAYDQWRAGNRSAAVKALGTAEQKAGGASDAMRRRIALDRAALSLDKSKLGELEALGDKPPEALVDVGIVYDLLGRSKDAYDAWVRAKAKGVSARDLVKWIEAKKRIYGY